jgi:hypothetical protein
LAAKLRLSARVLRKTMIRSAMTTSDDHRATRRMLGRVFDIPADLDLAA